MNFFSLRWGFFPCLTLCFVLFSVTLVEGQIDTMVICKLEKQVRTLRIQKSPDHKNVLIYRKYSKDEEIGHFSFVKSAQQVMREVQGNLEKNNWVCREVSQSQVLDTTL
jgi:hypothetical protein